MLCPKCGKNLPESAKFCDACGSAVNQKPPQKKPLWKTLIISALVIGLGTLIGKAGGYLLAASFNDSSKKNDTELFVQAMENGGTSTAQQTAESTTEPTRKNELFLQMMEGNDSSNKPTKAPAAEESTVVTEYDLVFSDRGLVDSSGISADLSSMAFVRAYDASGIECVEKQEFGCENDIVIEMEYNFYYRTADFTSDQCEAFDTQMRTYFEDGFGGVDCATIRCTQKTDYYMVRITFRDLDVYSNMLDVLEVMESFGSNISAEDYNLSYIPAPSVSDYSNYYSKLS